MASVCTDDDQIEAGGHSHQSVTRRTFFDHHVDSPSHLRGGEDA